MTVMRRQLSALAAVLVLLTACSGGGSSDDAAATTGRETSTTKRSTTTTSSTTTTTTLPTPLPAPQPNASEPYFEIGTIEIPKINVKKPLLEGVTMSTLDRGPGHWPGTAMPGQVGNVVVGGHRTSKDRPFRYVDQLVPGDEVIFTTPAGRFVYTVNRTEVVEPTAMWVIDQTPAYTATLFACHPVGSTAQRIIIFLDMVQ